jgi:hypothetical protein
VRPRASRGARCTPLDRRAGAAAAIGCAGSRGRLAWPAPGALQGAPVLLPVGSEPVPPCAADKTTRWVVPTAKKQHDETLELLVEINLLKRSHTWGARLQR